jgi:hypothetical protein
MTDSVNDNTTSRLHYTSGRALARSRSCRRKVRFYRWARARTHLMDGLLLADGRWHTYCESFGA